MKLLLDESIPRKLQKEFPNHFVSTVAKRGWTGKKNGDLLKLAGKDFDVFITVDQNIHFQHNIKSLKIAVIVLMAKSNRLEDIKPFVPQIDKVLKSIVEGEILYLSE